VIDPPAPDSAFRSDVGRVRSNNEDAVGAFEPADDALRAERGCLYVVADGMGGHAAGEVASNYAVASILRDYYLQPWAGVEAGLRSAVASANTAIHEKGSEPGEHQGMGCTVVAAALVGDRAVIINVGDSRAYLLRDGALRQVSLDHSWIAERVAIGLLTPEEAAAHPGKNVLTRNLGFTPETDPSVADIVLQAGDRLLLCSDGLSGPIAEDRIAALLGEGSAEQAVTALIEAANGAGGPDNIGVAVIAFGAERAAPPRDRLEALPAPAWLSADDTAAAVVTPLAEPQPEADGFTQAPARWEMVGVMLTAIPPAAAAPAAAAAGEPAAAPVVEPDAPGPAAATRAPEPAAAAPAAWPQIAAAPFAATAPASVAAPPRTKRARLLAAGAAAAVLAGILVVGGIVLAGRGGSGHKAAAGVAATGAAVAAAPLAIATTSTTAPSATASPAATATPLLSALATAAPSTATVAPSPTGGPANPGDGNSAGSSAATTGGSAPLNPTVASGAGGNGGGGTTGFSSGGAAATPGGASTGFSSGAGAGTGGGGAAPGGGTTGFTTGGTLSGGGVVIALPVIYHKRAGDSLQNIWQSCYTQRFKTVADLGQWYSQNNPLSPDFDSLPQDKEVLLPGGFSGENCTLGKPS